MKTLIFLSAFAIVGSCANKSYKEKIEDIKSNISLESPENAKIYSETITANELKDHLVIFSSAKFEGRAIGTKGQKLAAQYLENYYMTENIQSPLGGNDYFQNIPKSFFGANYNNSENVLAFIKGSEAPEEVIIISGHFDHEGVNNEGEIHYGADDNGSGTSAILEIAQAFQKAKDDGFGPKRSVAFLHTTAEEIGLHGSRFYTENPVFSLDQTVANLNIDMIGRIDERHLKENNDNYIYLIGSNRLSTELHYISEAVNQNFPKLDLNYHYNSLDDPRRYYYRSDHYNFAKHNIPVIFYFNGEHDDYHKPTDTPDKIFYPLLEKRAKLIFATAWQLANQEQRIEVDKAN
jgi:Zn-dependent M28 family amino/carboxypeptidase